MCLMNLGLILTVTPSTGPRRQLSGPLCPEGFIVSTTQDHGVGWLKIRSRIMQESLEQGLQTVAREPDPACRQLCERHVFGT